MLLASPRPGKGLAVLVAVLATGFALCGLLATSLADASSNYGKVTVSGSAHRTYLLSARIECRVFHSGGLIIDLNDTRSNAGFGIGDSNSRASTHSVNLAKTKDYSLTYTEPGGATWRSGWGPNFVVRKEAHYGSGTLSMSKNGKSGSVSTSMTPDHSGYTPGKGTVHVTASWHCP